MSSPNRVRVATQFMDNVVPLSGTVREPLGFSGTVEGVGVTVIDIGYGGPSADVYLTDILPRVRVDCLMRIGTCNANSLDIQPGDLVLPSAVAAYGAVIERMRNTGREVNTTADPQMVGLLSALAKEAGFKVHEGPKLTFVSSDTYSSGNLWAENVDAYEMECATVFARGNECGIRVAGIFLAKRNVRQPLDPGTNPEAPLASEPKVVEFSLKALARSPEAANPRLYEWDGIPRG